MPDDGDELYLTFKTSDPLLEWVERHVIPYLDSVSEQLSCPAPNARGRGTCARTLSGPRRGPADRRRLARRHRATLQPDDHRPRRHDRNSPRDLSSGADEQLQHCCQQQGAAQCAPRRTSAARSHRRYGVGLFGGGREAGPSAVAVDPGEIAELQLAAVMGLDAHLAHRPSVAPVRKHDLHLAIAPFLAPLAKRQNAPAAAPRPWLSANRSPASCRPDRTNVRGSRPRPSSRAGPTGCCGQFRARPGIPRNAASPLNAPRRIRKAHFSPISSTAAGIGHDNAASLNLSIADVSVSAGISRSLPC